MAAGRWRFWADRGGTFTDVVALAPDGALHRLKLLSEDPGRYGDAAEEAMRRLTGTRDGPLPACELRLGTTVATNALLERRGEPVVLATTRGFADLLRIGSQERPDIFALDIRLPEPLHSAVIEIDERVAADDEVLVPLDEERARTGLRALRSRGFRAVAIALMHSWRFPAHEARLAEIAREEGFAQVSISHATAPLIRLVPRADTTLADAYLSPVLDRYLAGLEAGLGPAVELLTMQSNGGLAPRARFRGKDAVLSGPAGGIVGMAAAARSAGFDHVVGFDMGGTSTDVSHHAGHYERDSETRVAGVRLRVPMMRIATVAAGGGSICRFGNGRFVVGPQSAGAQPGPACYGRGGPLTVTDCNLLLGKLQPDHFPRLFGPDGNAPLSLAATEARIDEVLDRVEAESGRRMSRAEAAEGFIAVANTSMAQAIRTISLQRGHDLAGAALVSFGGAAGQHACRVAEALGMATVLVHPLASVLSAWGMGLARQSALHEETLGLTLGDPALAGRIAGAMQHARAGMGQGARAEASVLVRAEGSASTIEVPAGTAAGMLAAFERGWQARFGFAADGAPLAETLRVEVWLPGADEHDLPLALPALSEPPLAEVRLGSASAPLYRREGLASGFHADGPALVVDDVSTVVVEPGWSVAVDARGNLILRRQGEAGLSAEGDTACDPVRLEIMGALFMGIAEEMGAALQQSARSVNIRERLDFSCALFDAGGNLVANAPHMPVHLGSMGESVRAVLRRHGAAMRPGDAFALNAPSEGGTHLPDITVVMPVFADAADAAPAWFVAARGHHADIGGISPGSMPPASTSLAEEGVVLDAVPVIADGRFREAALRGLLGQGPWPARNPDQNIADLKAQVAACMRGASALRDLARTRGRAVVDAYMAHVQDHAEASVRALAAGLHDGGFRVEMDNGLSIAVAVRIDRPSGGIAIDFAGTSDRHAGNFNAPLPVVRAAVLYVVRCLVGGSLPLNEGCMRPITLRVPACSMLDPGPGAAVVAGNVETSQVLVDALFGAFGALAASQGTMNNLTFGNAAHQYYETIAGGTGAGRGFAGASAVQSHMTNSRLTDPEVLEASYPVRLESFSIRRGSGGEGEWRGGDGVVRRIRALEPLEAGMLANRRSTRPFGLAGGGPGLPGRTTVERAGGGIEELAATAAVQLGAGDLLVIETPGGGGFGTAPAKPDPV